MNISLDEQIKKDKQKLQQDRRTNSTHSYTHSHSHSHSYNKNRFYHDRSGRFGYQGRDRERERERDREMRVFVSISHLHYSVTKEQLQEVCEAFGRVKSCRIQWDKMGRSNQKATVEYFNRSDSENAVQKLKGTKFQDQTIEVELVEEQQNLMKKHEIRKNKNHRFRQFSNNMGKSGNGNGNGFRGK